MKKILLALTLVLFAMVGAMAQKSISGKVTDQNGQPLIGASILAKGTTVGTVSDVSGIYSLTMPPSVNVVVVSYTGFTTQELTLGESSTLDVTLKEASTNLTELVVTGSGVATSKARLGISVETISAKDLPSVPSASVDQALVGKIAGAQISSTSGSPGAGVNILLRGINSVNRGTTPMILVDGLQMAATDLNALDLNSIDRIEVVQGAASASIYGAQGANGVIQLFTKRGKSGKVMVDFSSGITNNTYLNIGGLAKSNLHGYGTDANNNVVSGSGVPLAIDPNTGLYNANLVWNSTDPANLTNKPYGANLTYHDHFKEFFVPANTFNNSVSISGGSDKFDFSVSGSNNRQYSNFINAGYNDRSNITVNVGAELAKGLRFRNTTQLVRTENTLNGEDYIFSIFNTRAFTEYGYKLPDGSYVPKTGDAAGVNGFNPLYAQQYRKNNDLKIDVIQNFNLNYKFAKFVELDAKYGINYRKEDFVRTVYNQSGNAGSEVGQNWVGSNLSPDNTGGIDKYFYTNSFQNFLATAYIRTDFQKDFGMKIPITTSTQLTFDHRNQKNTVYSAATAGLPTYTPFTGTQGTDFKVFDDYTEPFVTYGFLVNQKIEFGDIAGVSAGVRSDYSSAFGEGSKPFTFPRGDAYLRLSSMDFWKNGGLGRIMPEFKLRAAYGQAGIQPRPFDRYVTLSTRTLGASNGFYFNPSQNNPALNVEVSEEQEIGTDITFNVGGENSNWLNSLRLSATYWKRTTDNAIWDVNVAPSAGSGALKTNAFSLGSSGLQASLNASVFRTNNFNWNFTLNFSKQTSQINSVVDNQEIVIISSAGSTNYVLRGGEKIGQLYGYFMLHSIDEKKPDGTSFIPSDQQSKYTLGSNGWVIDKATKFPYVTPDKYSFGDPNPKFNLSFINDITISNWLTFSFQIDVVSGNHLYNQTKEWMYRDGIHADYAKSFSIDGQEGAWTAFYRGVYAAVSRNGTKNYFYEDASFARLRNVAVAVDFAKVTKLPLLRKLQLVLSGRNLVTITKYTGMDPEIGSGTTNSAWDRGTDHNTMPNFKAYQATLNFGF
jgi:TonB-dependent starch-binding outer membrane protein SusC